MLGFNYEGFQNTYKILQRQNIQEQSQSQRSLVRAQPAKLMLATNSTIAARKNSASWRKSNPRLRRVISSTATPSGQKMPETKALRGKSSPTTIRQKSWKLMRVTRQSRKESMRRVRGVELAAQDCQNPETLSSGAGSSDLTLGACFLVDLAFIISLNSFIEYLLFPLFEEQLLKVSKDLINRTVSAPQMRIDFKIIDIIQMSGTTNIKYRVNCEILRLKVNKNINFETKIAWKRHHNKAETSSVQHSNGYSIFNETLSLDFNMPFNQTTHLFEQKKTQFVAIIVYQGKVKSGGYAKYNIANQLNSNPHGESKISIPMTQCPDPSAFLEVSFSYQRLSDELDTSDISVLNASVQDLNMSRIDFRDDRLSLEMDRIHQTIKKFEQLAHRVKNQKGDSSNEVPSLITKIDLIQGQKEELKKTMQKLQKQMKDKEQMSKSEQKKAQQETQDLERQLHKKNKEIQQMKGGKENAPNYKQMYETALKELEELKSHQTSVQKSIDFKFSHQMEDVREIADFDESKPDEEDIQKLSRHNVELQSQVASMSHKLAQLFNASYEYGGAKLLDYLQTEIGLTQIDE